MNSALWGLVSSASLGTADFMGRFSARAVGAVTAYFYTLLVGAIGSSIWMWVSATPLPSSPAGIWLAIAHGLCVTLMCVLLYAGLARGPVGIVAPIVAAHPAFVLLVNFAMGVRPSAGQWAAMAAIIAGGILIGYTARSHPHFSDDDGQGMRGTLLIAVGACLAYVLLVLTGQAAVPLTGALPAVWIGRCSGFALLSVFILYQRAGIGVPRPWIPFLLGQGVLDGLGYVAFLVGSGSSEPHIAMVVASTFSVFTVLLARIVLNEPVLLKQWLAIALITLGTAVLADQT